MSEEAGEGDTRNVVHLLTDQFEFCDVLVINKCDMFSEEELEKLDTTLKGLQPRARFIRASHGKVDPEYAVIRLLKWMAKWPKAVVRSKGILWFSTRNNTAISVQSGWRVAAACTGRTVGCVAFGG